MFRFNGLHSRVCFAPANDGGAEAPASFENVATESTSNVLDVLHFDPFKKGDEIPAGDKKPADTGKEGTSGDGKENGSPAAKAAPETKTPAPATTPAPDAENHWKSIAENYKSQLDAKTTPPAESSKGAPAKPELPKYDFNIPDALIDVLTTETDKGKFKEGVAALASGIANAIQATMLPYIEAQFNPRFDTIPQMLQAHIAGMEKAKNVRNDFYGKYPELNKPQLHAFIRQIGDATAKELNISEWNETLRDETAKRVKEIMAMATGAPAKPAPAAPRMIGGNSARTAPANDDAGDIADTIFGNF